MPNANQAVRFIACTYSSYTALGTYNENTIYFCTDTLQIFLGSKEYTKSIKVLDAQPNATTVGESGRLYVYNGNLYMCTVSGYTYTWTRIANVNDDNGTVTSIEAGSGLTGGTITASGTISHQVPTGASSRSDSATDVSPNFGGTFRIIGVDTDQFGHVTAVNLHTVTMPSETQLNVSSSAEAQSNLASEETFSVVTEVTKGTNSHDISVKTKTFKLPQELNTTYVISQGTTDGTVKVTPSEGDAYEVEVKGWSDVAKKTDISAVFQYKGAVATFTDLPTTDIRTGDVYSVSDEGTQYVYAEGSGWEKFGSTVDLTDYAKSKDVIQRVNGADGQVPKFDADGTLSSTGYTLGKSVPNDAVFTDTVYTHDQFTEHTSDLYKIEVNNEGHVSSATKVTKEDITGLGIPGENTDTQVKTSENTSDKLYLAGTTQSGTATGELAIKTNVYAGTDGSLTATAFHGKADSAGSADNADSATKASQDASGNIITETYATKDEAAGYKTVWEVI